MDSIKKNLGGGDNYGVKRTLAKVRKDRSLIEFSGSPGRRRKSVHFTMVRVKCFLRL